MNVVQDSVAVQAAGVVLDADVVVPEEAVGVVLFAHGCGSSRDDVVIELNRQAMRQLAGETRLEIVPGATHLFEEPGALEQVARLARDWFVRHLRPVPDKER